ncbi:hypothetical protein U1Q18_002751, partial [Sarracenia purpurea var. burkii]
IPHITFQRECLSRFPALGPPVVFEAQLFIGLHFCYPPVPVIAIKKSHHAVLSVPTAMVTAIIGVVSVVGASSAVAAENWALMVP